MSVDKQVIGRSKTVPVFGQGDQQKAVISAVVVRTTEPVSPERLGFEGVVTFSDTIKEHISKIILPIIDSILGQLNISQKHYEISAVNLGAASSFDIGTKISGFSADVPIFLSLLSVSLNIPVPDDIVTTGHIASVDGDIRAVKALPAKVQAAISEPSIKHFIYPDLDRDKSLAALSPVERENSLKALMAAKDNIRTQAVNDIRELTRTVFAEEDILLSSLKEGFYDVAKVPIKSNNSVETLVNFLTDHNEHRFWTALQQRFLVGECDKGKELLHAFARFHIKRHVYPANLGTKLFELVCSLPPAIRRLKMEFPTLDTDLCIKISQFAEETDHKDVCVLFEAAHGRHIKDKAAIEIPPASAVSESDCTAFDAVVAQISEQALAQKYGISIDSARGSYILDSSTVASYDQFLDTIEAFYVHMCRHMKPEPMQAIDMKKARAEAIDLVERAFRNKGGAAAAFARARDGTEGGLRSVLDRLTEQLKNEVQTKHVQKVFKETLDPLDWEDRVHFMRGALKRLSPFLPSEIKNQPPERFARHYEPIAQAYAKSLDSINQILRTM